MPTYRVSKVSSTCCRKGLASRVASLEVLAVMLYLACASSGSLCRFAAQSLKCAECIRRAIPCNENFFKTDFDHLEAEKR
jgi:hypothetical protein